MNFNLNKWNSQMNIQKQSISASNIEKLLNECTTYIAANISCD